MEAFERWLESTQLSLWINSVTWLWPASETLHFLGLCLLVGTVGLFDLRLLGLAKRIPPGALHRLVPFGIFGFAVNVTTGVLFFVGAPHQYAHNLAFKLKMGSLAFAGINVLVFYATTFRRVKTLGAGDDTPFPAKVIGLSSLVLWVSVMTCGRLLTFFRP
jgi:hypothetical protein